MNRFRSRSALLWLCLLPAIAHADGPSIANLLSHAKQQVATGHRWDPPDNNAMQTLQTIMEHLSEATHEQLSEVEQLLDTTQAQQPDELPTPDRVAADDAAPDAVPHAMVESPATALAPASTQPAPSTAGATAETASSSASIEALLAQADRQIAAGHAWVPAGDSAAETLTRALEMLPVASPAETQALRALPAHLRARAQAAEAAAQSLPARDYRDIAAVLSGLPADADTAPDRSETSARDDAVQPRRPIQSAMATAPIMPLPRPYLAPDPAPAPAPAQRLPERSVRPRAAPANTDIARVPPRAGETRTGPPAWRQASGGRCRSLIQRVQIGEDLADADRTFLRRGCP